MNPVLESKKKMEELFEKIEIVLHENGKVISKLLVPIVKKENIDK